MTRRAYFSKLVIAGIAAAAASFAQYKAEPAGAPPSDLPAAYVQALQKDGTKVTGGSGAVSEIWLVSTMPSGGKAGEPNVTLADVPHGALLGVIRFASQGADRRGQVIKPGVYSLRYSMFPNNGDHQGVAPQRDFFVLSRIGDDPDPKAQPKYEALMDLSKKASGTAHPLVMSIWKADDPKEDFSQQGDDWVLQRKAGNTVLAIIVVGKAA